MLSVPELQSNNLLLFFNLQKIYIFILLIEIKLKDCIK